jgi:riboflavin synthase
MFTGLIEEIGQVKGISMFAGGKRIRISGRKVLEALAVDHSVSVSGICLTVVELTNNSLTVEAVGETLNKTTIASLRTNDLVNLERALRLGERLGGHLVQGHVNGIGTLIKKERRGQNWYVEVKLPKDLDRYLITEGSIAIDGISLTIAALNNNIAGISIIPHTYTHTTMQYKAIGQQVNVEVDYMARHLEKLIKSEKSTDLTFEKIKNMGYG